jgi:hypothetical protein
MGVMHSLVKGGFLDDAVNAEHIREALVLRVLNRQLDPHFLPFGLL